MMPVGVYKTQKSFFNKKPDIEKMVMPLVNYVKNKKSNIIVTFFIFELNLSDVESIKKGHFKWQ